MATSKPRLTITLSPSASQSVKRLATARQCPVSRVVAELVEEVHPVLARVASTLEAAQTAAHRLPKGLAETLDQAEARALSAVAAVMQDLTDIEKRMGSAARGRRRAPPRTPGPVTRGSGLRKPLKT